jgi:hypothetical protein
MNISRLIKISIAAIIAILLTGAFLFVKLRRDTQQPPQIQQPPVAADVSDASVKTVNDSVTAPKGTTAQVSQDVLQSLTAPAAKQTQNVK